MAHLLRLICFALLLVASGASSAATYYKWYPYSNPLASQPRFATPLAACQYYVNNLWGIPGTATATQEDAVTYGCRDPGGGYRGQASGTAVNLTCSGGQTAQFTGSGSTATWTCVDPTCPTNETYTNGACSCNSGFERVNGTCVSASEALCLGLQGTETYATSPGNAAPGASTCNATGCTTTYAGTVIRVKNAQGAYVTEGAATFTGATCTYSSETGSVEDSCPGGASGTVNGIVTCVAYDPKLNTIETDKGESTSTTDSNGTTETGKVTNTVCNAVGACTTTTTTTTSVNGGAPTTTTETKEEPRDEFCTTNPNSPQCKDSAFSGSCTGGFTCSGDAVQCAAARQVHETNCLLNKTTDQSALFNSERTNDTSPLSVNATSKSISQADFDSSNSLGVSAGVADVSISVMGQSIVLPLSNLNQYLAQLRLVLLACAWFIAYRIVSGSVRD